MYKRTLNLRQHKFVDLSHLQSEIEVILDQFLAPCLNRSRFCVTIIVGKGANSKRFINGKNPLRYYTEQYLKKLGLPFRNGQFHEGQEGVIVVEG